MLSLILTALTTCSAPSMTDAVDFDEFELTRISYFKVQEQVRDDKTNIYQSNVNAKKLGKELFFDTRLSQDGKISCATCHIPEKSFTDGRKTAIGLGKTSRNTPSLINLSFYNWFMWDGVADSLWSQVFHPVNSKIEMAGDWHQIYKQFVADERLRLQYNSIFSNAPIVSAVIESVNQSELDVFKVNLAKSLAAFQVDIVQFNSRFDQYVSQVDAGNPDSQILTDTEKRGLKLFIGQGNCVSCHLGPNLSDSLFHNIRLKSFELKPRDDGRISAIPKVKQDPFNSAGKFNDNPKVDKIKYLSVSKFKNGAFKTPSLRNVAETAPYMHDGSISSLKEVVQHYSDFENAATAEFSNPGLLRPADLTPSEVDDLVAFMKALTGKVSVPVYP